MTNLAVNAKKESDFRNMIQLLYEIYGIISITELKKVSPLKFD